MTMHPPVPQQPVEDAQARVLRAARRLNKTAKTSESPTEVRRRVEGAILTVRALLEQLDLDELPIDQLADATRMLSAAVDDRRLLDVTEAMSVAPHLPPPNEALAAGIRVRQLRLAIRATTGDVAQAAGLAEGTVRNFEASRRRARPRLVALLAGGLAGLANPGQLAAADLAEELLTALRRDGLLADPGEWDAAWLASRRRRMASPELLRGVLAVRRAHELAAR